MPIAPDRLQVEIAPEMMCPRPENVVSVISHMRWAARAAASPGPMARIAGSKAMPAARPI